MYDPEEVRSLGFVPVLTDEGGTEITSAKDLKDAFAGLKEFDVTEFGAGGAVKRPGRLAVRFVDEKK